MRAQLTLVTAALVCFPLSHLAAATTRARAVKPYALARKIAPVGAAMAAAVAEKLARFAIRIAAVLTQRCV